MIAFLTLSLFASATALRDFTPILAEAKDLYAPVAAKAGAELRIEIREDGPLSSASADRDASGNFIVRVDRGLLRSPKLTDDVLRLILCHELGHLFGGPPMRPAPPEWDGPVGPDGSSLFSAEGQADVYSARACFRKLGKAELPAEGAIPFRVRAECDEGWGSGTEGARTCRRAALAAYGFLTLDHDFPISFDLRDPSVADRTLFAEYPSRQCRLDSMLAAAAAREDWPLDRRNEPKSRGADGRLPCWFRATNPP